jgi:hypothetical protein
MWKVLLYLIWIRNSQVESGKPSIPEDGKILCCGCIIFILKEICSLSCKSGDRVLAGMICTNIPLKRMATKDSILN